MVEYRLTKPNKVRRRIERSDGYFVDSEVNSHVYYIVDNDQIGVINLISRRAYVMTLEEALEAASEMRNSPARKELTEVVNDGLWRVAAFLH